MSTRTPPVVDDLLLPDLRLAYPIALFVREVLRLNFLLGDEVVDRRQVAFTLCEMFLTGTNHHDNNL